MYVPFSGSVFTVSFRCYYPDGNSCNHLQDLPLSEIGRWIDCYRFTHPKCISISVKVWFAGEEDLPL